MYRVQIWYGGSWVKGSAYALELTAKMLVSALQHARIVARIIKE